MINEMDNIDTQKTLELRPIKAMELYKFCEIMMEAARWFEHRGEQPWQSAQIAPHSILANNRLDELYLAYLDGEAVAAMILSNHCNKPRFSEEIRRGSLFVHKLAVRRQFSGQHLAKRVLDWACQYGVAHDYTQLMLMCSCHNQKLQQRWKDYGFSHHQTTLESGETCQYYLRSLLDDEQLPSTKLEEEQLYSYS